MVRKLWCGNDAERNVMSSEELISDDLVESVDDLGGFLRSQAGDSDGISGSEYFL
jgi:hypothetical protein